MMKNDKKSKWRLLKLLTVLPLIGGLLWAFSEPVYEYASPEESVNTFVDQEEKETFIVRGTVSVIDTMQSQTMKSKKYDTKVTERALAGTSIVVKGTTTGTVADKDGSYELPVSVGDVLIFSFVGFETKEVKILKDQEGCVVVLSPTAYKLDPASYRNSYKGKVTPPPPLPSKNKTAVAPPPPPPPSKKEREVAPPPPPPPAKSDKPVFYVVEEMPSYKGGMESYFATLYTQIALVKKNVDLKGTVDVQFQISAKGELQNIKALNRLKDKEAKYAVKIVSEIKDWNPGVQRGKPVSTTLVVPVEFD